MSEQRALANGTASRGRALDFCLEVCREVPPAAVPSACQRIRSGLLPLLLSGLLAACVVPVRVPTHNLGPRGDEGKSDLSFLHIGQTTRSDVLDKLAWMDTGYRNDRLFLGRWSGSSWAIAWAIGGYYAAEGGVDRTYGTHNLVIRFDQKGIVAEFYPVPDSKLSQEFASWLKRGEEAPLDLTTPIQVSVGHSHPTMGNTPPYRDAILVLGSDFLEFKEIESKKPNPGVRTPLLQILLGPRPLGGMGREKEHSFRIPAEKVVRLSYAGIHSGNADPVVTDYTLYFAEKTSAGRTTKKKATRRRR